MGILNVDNIQPVGGGTTISLNSSEINVGTGITFESNGQAIYAGIVTATTFSGALAASNLTGALPAISGANLTGIDTDKISEGNTEVETVDTGSNGHVKVTTEGSERLIIDSDGNIAFNRPNATVGDNQSSSSTATPKRIVFNNTFSNGYTDSSLKLYLQNENATRLGFTVGPSYDLQYHSSGSATNSKHTFYTQNVERLRITASGLNVTGVGTFSGGVTVGYDSQYSPIQQADNTYFYTRADQATSVSGSNIQNLATGSIKISDTIPIDNMTRQSDAGAHSFYNSSSTSQGVRRDMTDANPFAPKSYGLTMGTLFYSHTSGNNGSGVIHYGGNATSQHFYIRYKYSGDSILVGEDTGSSDTWTMAYQNDTMSDSNWYFFVVAIERNGNLLTSLNGAPLTQIRISGTAPAPTNAIFGLAGDPYGDNASRHRYATAFWHRGVMSNELIAQEYAWLKTIWTGASLP